MKKINLDKIKEKIKETKLKHPKVLPDGSKAGRVTRQDILDVLNHYADPKKEKENVRAFLDSLGEGVIDEQRKLKILDDLESYPVDYERKKGLVVLG